jgi:hypothetical protein
MISPSLVRTASRHAHARQGRATFPLVPPSLADSRLRGSQPQMPDRPRGGPDKRRR